MGAFVFDLSALDGEGVSNHAVWHSSTIENVTKPKRDTKTKTKTVDKRYKGPLMLKLDEDLRTHIGDYLEPRAFDDVFDFATVLTQLYHDKEQLEYVNWLEKFHKFFLKAKKRKTTKTNILIII